jgi:hypothetical protein
LALYYYFVISEIPLIPDQQYSNPNGGILEQYSRIPRSSILIVYKPVFSPPCVPTSNSINNSVPMIRERVSTTWKGYIMWDDYHPMSADKIGPEEPFRGGFKPLITLIK